MNVNFIKAYTRDGTTAAHALTLESLGDGGICEDGRWLMLSSAYKVYWSGGGVEIITSTMNKIRNQDKP